MHDALTRVQRKAGRWLREWTPHLVQYRPVGVHPSSRELAAHPGSGTAYFGVVPGYTSYLVIPDDFYALASEYTGLHGKPHRQEKVPPAFVVELTNGRVYADNFESVAIISADGRLVGDVSFQYDHRQMQLCAPQDNNIFRQAYFQTPVDVPGTVCSLLSGGGAASGNYYHWLIDSLPRLHLVREAGLLSAVDYFLVYDKTKSFVRETMAALGIGAERLLDVATQPHLRARRLLATSNVRGHLTHTPNWAFDFLRRSLLPPPPVERPFSPNIYISRRDAPGRRILNEPALEELLREYGFETHVLTPYSQAEKTALFAQARVVVSAVGAGLANLAFSPVGAQLIELFPPSFVVADYLEFTARLGIGHQFLVGTSPQASTSRTNAQRDDLLVDLAAFRPLLEKALARTATLV
ncbi:glycosyltransferase family 61 protein [Hymenobacter rubripertinctus]|uniref:Glycosyltransferase family 61 protein n=1 Tax=Hymenobacter rubripertinctus TaxID=2029981 RepID=A0A418QQY5_9BACT|nr:glycosyltransferase family 61 protein [Hymenobacter rubripertinctus]RIY07522.1 glycosyltransferase family 61 protein [Hymenobacter rubripertinctus]